MALQILVNAGLLALPIAGSVGTLLGIDAHRQATGQRPLFAGDISNDGSTSRNGITNTRYCDLFNPISPTSKGQLYTLNPNQWGVTPDTTGGLCMNITTIANGSYPTNASAPEFSVTWQFDQETKDQVVHAFPNVQVDNVLPALLADVQHLNIDIHWTYGMGNKTVNITDDAKLKDVNTNVALDMFFDTDMKTAKNVSLAKYEMMIWFAGYGKAKPFGYEDGIVKTKDLYGTTFQLYTGQNDLKQEVLTWYAANTTEKFNGDILPLVSDLYTLGKGVDLSEKDYLGVLSLGTEAFSSHSNVTFWMPRLSIDIQT
ncbi:concanavalin A-like lectin/glucanase domain-containing protein [Aspergillus pseudonomiae]|uniref:xyloglucan-specific endo-beta-1,4-glucanase n=1 Tax=Aspergillus pseudonomiae TaxID=1506151 RepID=A0A5N7DHG1_9EURO|nr:concanavalin A-like lectin/glucanase domain-containing protein [Aspergillus pseudonomiae]KAB8264033.1 concanavalin A-like lectin/glucanase domain-containing protein [Aspergillus pseudonomiae]KAE8405871.1 concanavalin A-like lectin/glucanase domain-containing protein [Aspergillus pseudonomiae]